MVGEEGKWNLVNGEGAIAKRAANRMSSNGVDLNDPFWANLSHKELTNRILGSIIIELRDASFHRYENTIASS